VIATDESLNSKFLIFAFKAFFSSLIPEIPAQVRRALEREEYMAKVVLDQGLEESDEELEPETLRKLSKQVQRISYYEEQRRGSKSDIPTRGSATLASR
jgi:hypothetical protein